MSTAPSSLDGALVRTLQSRMRHTGSTREANGAHVPLACLSGDVAASEWPIMWRCALPHITCALSIDVHGMTSVWHSHDPP